MDLGDAVVACRMKLLLSSKFASKLLTQCFSASLYLMSVSQESSVQEEVEMMVESLLDVLLQTLLSIMSKSHSVETSRGQRCPQCTAEITVSALMRDESSGI